MQRVVRYSLVGFLTLAGLTACGDKITIPPVTTIPASAVVREVTVSPGAVTLNVGDKVTLAASVNADAGVTDRTVTWSSSSTAIATVDATGLVTAVATGTATIRATSKADATVSGAAVVTVGGGGGAPATVTISSINQTTCTPTCSSTPANLGAVAGQIDVTLNVDPGSAKLAGVDLLLNCTGTGNSGTDTVIATQNLTATNLAPEAAEAASAPVTLSYNTATFNTTTGATAFKNGSCILKARARTTTGTTVASSTQSLTLANRDVVVGTVVATKTATDVGGLAWNGGNVTITAIPVFFTGGRVAATTAVSFEGITQTLTNTAGGSVSATFTDGDGAASVTADINNITDPAAQATINVNIVDASGQAFNNAGNSPNCGTSICSTTSVLAGAPTTPFPITAPFRLDTRKPAPGFLPIKNNVQQQTSANGYINGTFRFAGDSAAGYCGPNSTGFTNTPAAGSVACTGSTTANTDNGGVDKVTVVFQTGNNVTTPTFTTATSTAALAESNTATSYVIRMITTDALGNADTSSGTTVFGTASFGVDKTAPSSFASTQIAGPVNQQVFLVNGGGNTGGGYVTSGISDNLSGPSLDPVTTLPRVLVAQTRNWSGLAPSATQLATAEGRNYTNVTTSASAPTFSPAQAVVDLEPCTIGRFNATAAAAGPNAVAAFDRAGAPLGFCTPIFWVLVGGSVPGSADINASSTSSVGGYYFTQIITVDQAGNRSTPFTNVIAEDAVDPTVSGIDLPGSMTGGASVSVSASAADNVDLTASYGAFQYNTAAMVLRYPNTAGPGVAFDNVLTRTATLSPVINNFIRNLAPPTAGTPTYVAGQQPQNLIVAALDEANRRGQFSAPLTAVTIAQSTATTAPFAGTTGITGGFALTANNNPIQNCPAATAGQTTGCGAGGTGAVGTQSTTLSASVVGASAIFNNPFTLVTYWYQNANSEWVQFGSQTGASVTDNGTNRTWTYTFLFDPPATGPDGMNLAPAVGGTIVLPIRAIGQNSTGDAVTTATLNLTLNNP